MKPQLLLAKDLMTRTILSVHPTMGMQELVDFFRENRIHGAIVQEGERLVGVVSLTDVLIHLSEESDDGGPFWRVYPTEGNPDILERIPEGMNDVTADDLMTPNVVTCDIDTTAGEIADVMWKESIHRAVVTEEGRAVGLISATDLLRAVAEYETAVKVGTSATA
jgi:predicted transcriptional regulator